MKNSVIALLSIALATVLLAYGLLGGLGNDNRASCIDACYVDVATGRGTSQLVHVMDFPFDDWDVNEIQLYLAMGAENSARPLLNGEMLVFYQGYHDVRRLWEEIPLAKKAHDSH